MYCPTVLQFFSPVSDESRITSIIQSMYGVNHERRILDKILYTGSNSGIHLQLLPLLQKFFLIPKCNVLPPV
jgi:hypothetical protein